MLSHVSPVLWPDVHRGQGQGARTGLREGLQRLDGRGVVRRLGRPAHPAHHRAVVGCRARRSGGAPQCRAGCARHDLLRDPPAPRSALHPHWLLGSPLRGLCHHRHGGEHAHRLELEDARNLRRRTGRRRCHPELRQCHGLTGRLLVLGRIDPLPDAQDRLLGGADRLVALHLGAGGRSLGGPPGMGWGRRRDP